jgi:hypothetical protein
LLQEWSSLDFDGGVTQAVVLRPLGSSTYGYATAAIQLEMMPFCMRSSITKPEHGRDRRAIEHAVDVKAMRKRAMSEWDHADDEDDASVLFFVTCNRKRHFREKRIARIRHVTSMRVRRPGA